MTEKHLKLEDYKWDAEWCMGCRGCTWVDHIYCTGIKYAMKCPTLYRHKFDSYSPFGKNKLALKVLDGGLDFTPRLLDIIYKCNQCGACDVGCKRNIDFDPGMVHETLRIRAVESGAAPLPAHKKVNDTISESNNRYGAPHADRAKWLPADAKVSDNPEFLYFVGCNTSYKNNDIALATIGILEAAGASYALFPQEICCGHPQYCSGDVDATVAQAEKNIQALKDSGATTIITSCAECYKTWKVDYPKVLDKATSEMGYKVVHIASFAAEKIADGTLKPSNPVNMKVSYHDSCNLNRLSEDWIPWHGTRGKYGCTDPIKQYRRGIDGVSQPPRDILNSIPGLELREMFRMDVNSMCCGAGGGVADAFPEYSQDIANHRLDEADDLGVSAVVAACPYCKDNFSKACKNGGRSVKTYDITQILHESLTGKGGLI